MSPIRLNSSLEVSWSRRDFLQIVSASFNSPRSANRLASSIGESRVSSGSEALETPLFETTDLIPVVADLGAGPPDPADPWDPWDPAKSPDLPVAPEDLIMADRRSLAERAAIRLVVLGRLKAAGGGGGGGGSEAAGWGAVFLHAKHFAALTDVNPDAWKKGSSA